MNKQIENIQFDKNEDIITKKLIKLESKEDLIPEGYCSEEGNSFYKASGFQPKYIVIK